MADPVADPKSDAAAWDKARADKGGQAQMPPRPADPPPPEPSPPPTGPMAGPAPHGGAKP